MKITSKLLGWGSVYLFLGAFLHMTWTIGKLEGELSNMARTVRWVAQTQQKLAPPETKGFTSLTLDRLAVRFGDKKTIYQVCGEDAEACWRGEKEGWHIIWLPRPKGPTDMAFLCVLYHEALHAELGRWHRNQPNSSCHDGEFFNGVR